MAVDMKDNNMLPRTTIITMMMLLWGWKDGWLFLLSAGHGGRGNGFGIDSRWGEYCSLNGNESVVVQPWPSPVLFAKSCDPIHFGNPPRCYCSCFPSQASVHQFCAPLKCEFPSVDRSILSSLALLPPTHLLPLSPQWPVKYPSGWILFFFNIIAIHSVSFLSRMQIEMPEIMLKVLCIK